MKVCTKVSFPIAPIAVFLVAAATGTAAQTITSLPVSPGKIKTFVNSLPAPRTLGALKGRSSLIVLGRVSKVGSPRLLTGIANSQVVVRDSLVEVEQVLKGQPATPSIRVVQTGGRLESDGTLIETNYTQRLLMEGERVVLFLSTGREDDTFFSVGGDGGNWAVESDRTIRIPKGLDIEDPDLVGRSTLSVSELRALLTRGSAV